MPTPFDQRLDDLIAQIDGWIRPYVERPDSPAARFYQMMAYHHGWVAADGTPLDPPARTGKRVRPILAILTCEAFGGTADDARGPAVALELIHNFSLVHDDIQDVSDAAPQPRYRLEAVGRGPGHQRRGRRCTRWRRSRWPSRRPATRGSARGCCG